MRDCNRLWPLFRLQFLKQTPSKLQLVYPEKPQLNLCQYARSIGFWISTLRFGKFRITTSSVSGAVQLEFAIYYTALVD